MKAAHEQIAKEIDELTGSVEGVRLQRIVERAALGGDDELANQLRERFEQVKSSGKFPLLSGYLSDFLDEEKEEFFKTGWLRTILKFPPEPPEEPWDYSPYNGSEDWYREDLYEGLAYAVSDLRFFAQEWQW